MVWLLSKWRFWCEERLIREMVSLLSLLVLGDSLGSLVAVELTVVVTLIFYWQVRCNNCWISYVRIHVFKFNPTTGKSVISKAILNISVSISLNLPLGQGVQLTDPSSFSCCFLFCNSNLIVITPDFSISEFILWSVIECHTISCWTSFSFNPWLILRIFTFYGLVWCDVWTRHTGPYPD